MTKQSVNISVSRGAWCVYESENSVMYYTCSPTYVSTFTRSIFQSDIFVNVVFWWHLPISTNRRALWICAKWRGSGTSFADRYSLNRHRFTAWINNYIKLKQMGVINLPISNFKCDLTHWDRVTHICDGKLTIIGSDNGLSPGRRQAIIRTNAGILLIEPLGTTFSEILIGIQIVSFKKMRLKMSSAKWRPFCLGLNVLIQAPLKLKHGWAIPCVKID